MDPPDDLATFIAAAGLSLTKGTNLFVSTLREVSADIPKNAVFLFGSAGASPERTMGEVTEVRHPHVLIRVRWSSFSSGNTKIRAIQDALQAASISGYLDVVALQAEPLNLGQDAEGLHMWGLTYQMVYENAS
jgi:hypothetical protein